MKMGDEEQAEGEDFGLHMLEHQTPPKNEMMPKPMDAGEIHREMSDMRHPRTNIRNCVAAYQTLQNQKRLKFNKRKDKMSMKGSIYEVKMSLLMFSRLMNMGKSFYLCSNLDDAGAFDDVVFKYKCTETGSNLVFLQLKHSENSSKKSVSLLNEKHPFGILKYFKSYCEILESRLTSNVILDDLSEDCFFILYTNAEISSDMFYKLEEVAGTLNLVRTGGEVLKLKYHIIQEIEKYKVFIERVQVIISNQENSTEKKQEAISKECDKILESLCCGELKTKVNTIRLMNAKLNNNLANEIAVINIPLMKDFFKCFFVLSKQCSESGLDDVIHEEISKSLKDFQLSSIEKSTIYRNLFDEIQIWWEENDLSFFLTEESTIWRQILGNVVKQRFSKRTQELANYGIHFAHHSLIEMIDYMKNVGTITFINTDGNLTASSTLKVMKALELRKIQDYILVPVEQCADDCSEIWKAWPSWWCNLLIIEVQDTSINAEWLMKKIQTDIKNHEVASAIIIISQQQNEILFQNLKDSSYLSIKDKFSYDQLDCSTQEMLQQKNVSFQGFSANLRTILSVTNFQSLSSDVLTKLFANEISTIGEDLKIKQLYNYIPRSLSRNILNKKFLRSNLSNTFIAFECDDENEIKKFLHVNDELCMFSDGNLIVSCDKISAVHQTKVNFQNTCVYLKFNKGKESEEFETLCKMCPNVHWVKVVDGNFILMKSYGNSDEVKAFITGIFIETQDEVLNNLNTTTLVIAEPGMGKTTLLNNISLEIKKLHLNKWVITIDLLRQCEFLRKTIRRDIDSEYCNEFIIQSMISKEVDRKVLVELLPIDFKIFVLLVDAFDEISPSYADRVCNILNYLQNKAYAIFVTSRPNMSSYLEQNLLVCSCMLKPLNENNQIVFLRRFWMKENPNLDADKVEHFAKQLLDLYSVSLKDPSKSFTGIPLQIQMLAEVYEESLQEYCENNTQHHLQQMNLLEIFEQFVEKKIKIFFKNKLSMKGVNPVEKEIFEKIKEEFLRNHKIAAILSLFNSKDIDMAFKDQLQQSVSNFLKGLENGNERTGIIDGIHAGLAHFTHRSFAEYFGAVWIAEHYEEEISRIIKNILFQDDMSTLRKFLDFKLAEKYPLHICVLMNDSDNVQELLQDDKLIVDDTDDARRTPLHLAASNGNCDIINILLKFGADIHKKDCTDLKPIQYAEMSKLWEAVELLLQNGGKPEDLKILAKNNEYENLQIEAVYSSCMLGLFNIIRLVLAYTNFNMNKLIYIPDTLHKKPLTTKSQIKEEFFPVNLSTAQGHTQVATLLIEHGANIKFQDRHGNTILHTASQFGNFYIAHLTILKTFSGGHDLAEYINCINKEGNTALHLAALSGSEDIVKLLLENGADVNILNRKLENPVFSASKKGHISIIINLLQNGGSFLQKNVDGESGFSVVVREGYVEAVNLFINSGLDIDYICDESRNTPLLLASLFGHISIVQLLLDMKCNINHINKSDETALSLSLTKGHLNIAKLLLNKCTEVNHKNIFRNALFIASTRGYLDIMKMIFLNDKESFSSINNFDKNCLHLAAENGHLNIIKFLLEKKLFDVNFINADSENALHIASRKGFYEIVKYLLDFGSEIDSVNRDGDTAFLVALRNGFYNIAEYLIERKTNFDHVNNVGNNACIICAENETPDVMKTLTELGIDINLVNIHGNNALITAIKYKNFKTCLLLIEIGGINLNHVNNRKENALLLVSRTGNFECLKCLIENGADIYHCDKDGNTALHLATKRGHLNIVSYLIAQYRDINIANKMGDTALLVACKNGYTQIVKLLIEKNADIDCCNNMKYRPLYVALKEKFFEIAHFITEYRGSEWVNQSLLLACSDHNLEAVKFLLKKGADINYYDEESQSSPLFNVVNGGFVEHVKFLVENGASIRGHGLRPEPFHEAAASGYVDIMIYLMSKGINVDEYNVRKSTALIVAAKFGKLEAVKLLVENGADINHVNVHGESALYMSVDRHCFKVVKYLIELGTNSSNINTAFMSAVLSNNIDIVKLFITAGADVNKKGNDSDKALSYASRIGNLKIVKLLVEHSADVNYKNKWGDTALMLSFKENHTQIVKYLIDKCGAPVEQIEPLVDTDWLFETKPEIVEPILSILSSHNSKPFHIAREKNTILIRSSLEGRFEILKYIIDLNIDIDFCDDFLNNALIFAAKSGCYNAVRLLVQKGININHANKLGKSALLAAACNGCFDIVKYLIANGANICHVDKRGNNALLTASKQGHINIIKFLLSKGVDISYANNKGDNILLISSRHGYQNIVEFAIQHGINVGYVNLHGMSALIAAVSGRHLDIVKFLIRRDVLIDSVNKWGYSALVLAAKKGDMKILKYLISKNADIEATDFRGNTALHWASDNGYVDIVELLVVKMSKVDLKNLDEETPLMLAVRKNHIKIARRLIAEGADVNTENAKTQTCLMIASIEGHLDAVKYLLKHRVEINHSDINGETALFYATRAGAVKVVQYLLDHGANIQHVNNKSENVLKVLQCGYVMIPEMLIEKLSQLFVNR